HVHENQVLTANQVHIARETFREQGVVERSEENHQRAPTQAQSNEGTKLVEVRRDGLRLQRVNRIATGGVVRLAVFRTNEFLHFITESQQAEQIALLLRGQTENQRRGDETFQSRSRGSWIGDRRKTFRNRLSTLDLRLPAFHCARAEIGRASGRGRVWVRVVQV